jgi:hypothetical protein
MAEVRYYSSPNGESFCVAMNCLPNLSLNADVPHAWAAPTGGPPVGLFR